MADNRHLHVKASDNDTGHEYMGVDISQQPIQQLESTAFQPDAVERPLGSAHELRIPDIDVGTCRQHGHHVERTILNIRDRRERFR